jgi:hypothetical protein
VFGLVFKVLLHLKKPKAKPNGLLSPRFFLEKLLFCSSILKAPREVLLLAVGFSTLKFGDFSNLTFEILKIHQFFKFEIRRFFKIEIW